MIRRGSGGELELARGGDPWPWPGGSQARTRAGEGGGWPTTTRRLRRVAEAFADAQAGFYDGETAERYRAAILSAGNGVPAGQAFRAFRGRDPDPGALVRRLGAKTNG